MTQPRIQIVEVLRCYAEPTHNGQWYAYCITLDLVTIGASFEEARQKLDDAIVGYIQTLAEKKLERELIPRPSPISIQARYWYLWSLTYIQALIRRRNQSKHRKIYNGNHTVRLWLEAFPGLDRRGGGEP